MTFAANLFKLKTDPVNRVITNPS
ncbi:hypothetical protein EMIT0P228_20616 [Pseudomonas brassicacearum]